MSKPKKIKIPLAELKLLKREKFVFQLATLKLIKKEKTKLTNKQKG